MSLFYFQGKMKIARGVLNKITPNTFHKLTEVFFILFVHGGWDILEPMIDIIIQKVMHFNVRRLKLLEYC